MSLPLPRPGSKGRALSVDEAVGLALDSLRR